MRFRNVWFRDVLKGIDLEGERIFVCGYNGSGKTTLLKIASHLLKPDRGEVKGKATYVPQNVEDYILFNTVKGEILIQAEHSGVDTDRALRIAKNLGLEVEKRTDNLSDGEKRLLTIALALIKGDSLALDEPFANLHPSVAKNILKILKRYEFLIAENRLEFCRDFFWLENGKISDPPNFEFEVPKCDPGEVVLRVENLTFGYERPLFEDLSFEVRKGEIVAIVGMNGCGKTTLLKVVAGFLKPWSGEVTVKGRIGVCLSNPFYHVQEPLSFGQAKVKAIKMALKGDLVLLDEPTAGLDVKRKFEVLNALRRMRKTALMATHDHEILEFCDDVIEI